MRLEIQFFFLDIMDQLIEELNLYKIKFKVYIYTSSNLFYEALKKYSHIKKYFITSHLIDHKKLNKKNNQNFFYINIGNRDNLHTPSKICELIGNNRRIINFHHNQETDSQQILKLYPNHININLDKRLNSKNLINFLKNSKVIYNKKIINKCYNENTLPYILRKYFL